MEELKRNENLPVEATAKDNVLTVRFDKGITPQDLQLFAGQMQEMMESFQAKMETDNEKTMEEIKGVKQTIERDTIDPEDLQALESLIDKKARKFVNDKKGIQLNIDVLLNYDSEGLIEFQKLVNKEVGKTKQKIWVELNKKCLKRKGTDPKNRIPKTLVGTSFDFVRTWGGFSV